MKSLTYGCSRRGADADPQARPACERNGQTDRRGRLGDLLTIPKTQRAAASAAAITTTALETLSSSRPLP
jgi:hypothetical protein